MVEVIHALVIYSHVIKLWEISKLLKVGPIFEII